MIDIQNNNARIPNCKRKDSVRTGGNTLISEVKSQDTQVKALQMLNLH
ncbi:MAG: hypothetical protein IPP01_14515 [Saprospiraceae bacterium]|nr:hypothetical protein [Saprospiraceae bacterium]